ncbi:hypothetical protein [Metabacillus fastidiosus]|uniref:hypothetical protein n=1 Tax=Metabacillus fastidiosus TaxID=1458 RepID=UPI002E1D9CD3|nr:hypothetical protein [Metabacillus fastidiosus]
MYKLIVLTILTVSISIIAGCSNKTILEEKIVKTDQEIEKADDQFHKKDTAAEPKSTGDEEKQEDIPWDGQWIFLSDDDLGQLQIEVLEGNKINYTLGGTRINPINNSSYANSFEGTGVIQDNKAEFTNNLVEGCGGVMEKKGTIITLIIEDESCHTPQVYLNGDYKKVNSIGNNASPFAFKNGEFYIYGISLGDTPSTVKGLLGNPDYEGPDEEGFYEWIQDYSTQSFYISYSGDNTAESIHAEADESELKTAIAKEFKGQVYIDDDGSNYLFNPDNKQLLIFNEKEQNGQMISFLVTYADGNFHQGIEQGWIRQK